MRECLPPNRSRKKGRQWIFGPPHTPPDPRHTIPSSRSVEKEDLVRESRSIILPIGPPVSCLWVDEKRRPRPPISTLSGKESNVVIVVLDPDPNPFSSFRSEHWTESKSDRPFGSSPFLR